MTQTTKSSPFYILDAQGEPTPTEDLDAWSAFMDDRSRLVVALDDIGAVRISTVFLGIDHQFRQAGPPMLFESMIFGGPHDEEVEEVIKNQPPLPSEDELRAYAEGKPPEDLPFEQAGIESWLKADPDAGR